MITQNIVVVVIGVVYIRWGKKMRRTLSSSNSISICPISIGFDMHYVSIYLSSQENFYNNIFDRF